MSRLIILYPEIRKDNIKETARAKIALDLIKKQYRPE
jgi:hypothetical protein